MKNNKRGKGIKLSKVLEIITKRKNRNEVIEKRSNIY